MTTKERTIMQPSSNGAATHFVLVRPEPPGQFTAQVVGVPELRAIAAARDDAIREVQTRLSQWLASGELVAVQVRPPNSLLAWCGWAKEDPLYQEYLDEIAQQRQEELASTSQVDESQCPNSSSTPIT
jgi:hypothetical protein